LKTIKTGLTEMTEKKLNAKAKVTWFQKIMIVICLYFMITQVVYRFRHPEQTETELFKNIPKSLLWK
jgi:hypothetical protein